METKDRKRQPPRRPNTAPNRKNPSATREKPRRKPQPKPQTPAASEVVYTQPQPFHRGRLLLRLATVAAVVLALLFGMSIFFKVDEEKITVAGAEKYTPWQIREASGILDGENLLTLSDAKISANIIKKLPYVKHVRVGIQLPDTVHIEIVELDVVYAMEAVDGSWWLISAAGDVIERVDGATASGHTKISGVRLQSPQVGQKAQAEEDPPHQTDPTGGTAPITVTNRQRLETVITILEYLEGNGIIGQAASLNVSDLGNIEFWYGQQYRVLLGDSLRLGHKITNVASVIKMLVEKNGVYHTGVLDASYTTYPDEIHYGTIKQ